MPKYHISKKGLPAECTAQPGHCRLTEDDGSPMPHFGKGEEALEYIEQKAEKDAEKEGSFSGVISKKSSSSRGLLNDLSEDEERDIKRRNMSFSDRLRDLEDSDDKDFERYVKNNSDDKALAHLDVNIERRALILKHTENPGIISENIEDYKNQVEDIYEKNNRDLDAAELDSSSSTKIEKTRNKVTENLRGIQKSNVEILQNKNLSSKQIFSVIENSPRNEEFKNDELSSKIDAMSFNHRNMTLSGKNMLIERDFEEDDKGRAIYTGGDSIDKAFVNIVKDDYENSSQGANFSIKNGDGTDQREVNRIFESMREISSEERKSLAKTTDSPEEIRALMFNDRNWHDLEENPNLNEKQKNLIEDHNEWLKRRWPNLNN